MNQQLNHHIDPDDLLDPEFASYFAKHGITDAMATEGATLSTDELRGIALGHEPTLAMICRLETHRQLSEPLGRYKAM